MTGYGGGGGGGDGSDLISKKVVNVLW